MPSPRASFASSADKVFVVLFKSLPRIVRVWIALSAFSPCSGVALAGRAASETFKLQGFPVGNGYKLPEVYKGKKYSDAQLYKQAGNAVSVDMITMIATEILKILD